MSNPTRVSAGVPDGGRFAPNGQTESDVSLAATDPADLELEATDAALAAEISAFHASRARLELMSAKSAALTILKDFPDATYLQMGFSDQTMGAMVPEAILDADGEVISDDYSDFDDLQNVVGNMHEDGAWTAHCDNENEWLDLKSAAAISQSDLRSATGMQVVYADGASELPESETAGHEPATGTRQAADRAVATLAQGMNRASALEADLLEGRLGIDPAVRAGCRGQIASIRTKATERYLSDLEAAVGIGRGLRPTGSGS